MTIRIVAATVACALFLAAMPAIQGAPGNDCTPKGTDVICHMIEVDHHGAPAVSSHPYWGDYYVYLNVKACRENAFSRACDGHYEKGGVPMPAPAPDTPGANVIAVLYKETNGAPGLQREPVSGWAADRAVLV